MARKPRDSKIPDAELLIPFDVAKFGSEDDPCFGKLYSLTEPECLHCGDNEFCGTVFANDANRKRIAQENKGTALDMEIDTLELEQDIKDYAEMLDDKGIVGLLKKVRLRQRFRLTDDKLKQYL